MFNMKNRYVLWMFSFLLCFSNSITVLQGEEQPSAEEPEIQETAETELPNEEEQNNEVIKESKETEEELPNTIEEETSGDNNNGEFEKPSEDSGFDNNIVSEEGPSEKEIIEPEENMIASDDRQELETEEEIEEASEAFAIYGDFTYYISNGTATIDRYTGSDTEVVIPSEISDYPVTSIGSDAFYNCSSLTSITIPDSVTSIGSDAFYYCSSLTSITIPDSVTSIGNNAFYGCNKLEAVSLGNSVTSIGSLAFYYCSSLTSITIPDSVTNIGHGAFTNCLKLTSITIPNNVTSIGSSVFSCCHGLTSITIPDSVTSIGSEAFYNCSSLTSITIPDSVTSIGSDAFRYTSLKKVFFLGDAPSISPGYVNGTVSNNAAFDAEETILIFDPEAEGWTSPSWNGYYTCPSSDVNSYIDAGLAGENIAWTLSGSGNSLKLSFTGSGNMFDYSEDYINSKWMSSASWANYYDRITSIELSNEITYIGNHAFHGLSALSKIPSFENIKIIGAGAFEGCSSMIGRISLPDSLVSIGESAFEDCKGLSGNLIIPDGVESLGSRVFYGCSGFYGRLSLPEGLTEIPQSAFSGCHFTGTLTLPGTITTIGSSAFYENGFTGDLIIPEGVVSIGSTAFYRCEHLEGTLSLPSTLTSIGGSAFAGACFTGDLVIPSGITKISDGTFGSLTSSVTTSSDGTWSFWSPGNFDGDLILPEGLESIGTGAFNGAGFTGNLILPNSVATIGERAFRGTRFTGSLVLPENLMTIGGQAFDYTAFEDGVVIPGNVITIGASAFLRSKHLIHFTFEGEDPTIVANGSNGSFPEHAILLYPENIGNYTTPKWNGYSAYPVGTPTAEGVTITADDNIIQNGKQLQLTANVIPADAANKKVTWSVKQYYGTSYFSVDQNGVVTTTYNDNSYTTGVIVATTEDGGYTAEFNVISTGYSSLTRVKGLKMEKERYRMISGSSMTVYAIIDPFGASIGTATWTSSDPSVATVNDAGNTYQYKDGKTGNYAALGRVTAVSPGTAVITATSTDGNYTATCEIVVVDASAGLVLNYESMDLLQGETKKITAFTAGEDTEDQAVTWTSSDPTVASVDQNGNVYAVNSGAAVITARSSDGSSATCTVTVTVKLLKLELDVSSLSLIVGDTFALTPVFVPANAVADELIWESDNENVINVDDGQITAVSEGTANATVRSSDGTLFAVCTVTVTGSTVMAEDIPEGGIPDGLWIAGVTDRTYDGTAQKQEIRVYDSQTLLKEKTDYTVSYQNNKNAAQSTSSNAPAVIVTMKGNYQGKLTEKFTIYPVTIEDNLTVIDDITTMYTGRAQLKVPSVIVNGVKLKNGRDYTVTYDLDENYFDPGEYPITVTGIGNYTGTREIHEVIADSTAFLMNKATVSKIPKQLYTGNLIEPSVTVKYKGVLLKEDQDYEVSYRNNISVGTGEMILSGLGDYTGNKIIKFSITGIPLKNASLLGWESGYEYIGTTVTQKDYELVYDDQPLVEGQDYQVIYENNLNAGKAKVTFIGIGGFTGKLTKTFKIAKTSIGEAEIDGADSLSTVFAKGGAKIFPTVVWNGRILKEGTDYTLKYANNKKVHDGTGTSKVPTVTITGKGNFSSKQVLTYAIVPQSLKELTMTVNDKLYSVKANAFKSKPVITDLDGKKLAVGTDYDKNLVYSWTSSTPPASGTRITVTAKGKGNYIGTISSTYRIIQNGYDISKARASAASKTYTGRSITLFPNRTNGASGDLIVTLNGVNLICGKDYEITGYSNNINAGKATVTIRGIGVYGGQKTVQFQITKTIAVRSCGPNAYYEGGACICYPGYTGNPNTGCTVSINPTPTPDQHTPEPTTTPVSTPEPIPTLDLSTPEPPTPTPVTCGENAYESGGACYCNDGYTGDPYSACYVIIPDPTPDNGGGEDSGGDAEGGEG